MFTSTLDLYMANKSFESRMHDYEVFCGAFIRNILLNRGKSPAQIWMEVFNTKSHTNKLESILEFMVVSKLIKHTTESRLDKRTYKISSGKRDSAIIDANLRTYFDLSADNKGVTYKLNEDGYLCRVKSETPADSEEDAVFRILGNSDNNVFDNFSDEDLIAELKRRHSSATVHVIIKY